MCKCENCEYYDPVYFYDDETYKYYKYNSHSIFLCEKYDKMIVHGKIVD